MKGTLFSEVDLEDGEWNDYDEKVRNIAFHRGVFTEETQTALPVGVSDFGSRWTKA